MNKVSYVVPCGGSSFTFLKGRLRLLLTERTFLFFFYFNTKVLLAIRIRTYNAILTLLTIRFLHYLRYDNYTTYNAIAILTLAYIT